MPLLITEELSSWHRKHDKRCDHEWAAWDGTEADGIRINDAQCERTLAARQTMKNTGIAEKRPDTWQNHEN